MISKTKNFLLLFSTIFFMASITSFTAFNWSHFSSVQKLLIPITIMFLGILCFLLLKKEKYKNLSLFFACFMIGILFASFGQIYQTGADSWILFRNWAFFLILPVFLSMSYAIFSLLVVIITLMLFFYLGMYFNGYQAFHMACFFPAFILLLYPFVTQKGKIPFHDIFYRSFLIPFYVIFNLTSISSPFVSGGSSYSPFSSHWPDTFLAFGQPLLLGLLFVSGYIVYKKTIVLPFSILSAGVFIWESLSKVLFHSSFQTPIFYYILSLTIFLGTLVVLMKSLPELKDGFVEKIFRPLGNFLKFLIFLFSTGLILSVTQIMGSGNFGFLVIGVGLLALSCYFPKWLHFKEDTLEIVSFSIGLFTLNYFLVNFFDLRFAENIDSIVFLATFNVLVFDIFWYFRANKSMDLCFACIHYIYIFILFYRFFGRDSFTSPLPYINSIFIIGLCILPLQMFFNSPRIHRIFYGSNLSLLLIALFFPTNFFGTTGIFMEYFRTVLILVASLFLFVYHLIQEYPKRNVKYLVLFSSLLLIISYLASYVKGAEYILLLLLLYVHRQSKWTSYLLSIVLCLHVFHYYYSLSTINLAQKSLSLFAVAITLFTSYVILKYFGKELSAHETEAK